MTGLIFNSKVKIKRITPNHLKFDEGIYAIDK